MMNIFNFGKEMLRLLNHKINGCGIFSNIKTCNSYSFEPLNETSSPALSNSKSVYCSRAQSVQSPDIHQKPVDRLLPGEDSLMLLNAYLFSRENSQEDISKLKKILKADHIIFEIGCGSGEVAWEIAKKNPYTGVIAIDKYDWTVPLNKGSHYQKTALVWREKRLKAQQYAPENLVLLRGEGEIIRFFPDHCIDTVLMINPEPKVCEAFLKFISQDKWFQKIKPGSTQIFVVPFSRELGVSAYGGFEWDYSETGPVNLDYLSVSPFEFRRGEKNHWGLDLSRASAYSRNSTRNDVYIYGNQFQVSSLSAYHTIIKKIFCISILGGI
jgi:hypothetical protein